MKFYYLIRAMLREIFDEAAYERFCRRRGLIAGQESYAKFVDENASPARSKLRCC
jgi:DNA-directed RNA polymerase subunit N (RpoN/RPB10)